MYYCPIETPGYLPEPYHIPGYGGHIPSYRARNGGTFGRLSRDCIEDPCVAQAPCPILQDNRNRCCPEDPCCRNPLGCQDIGCCDPVYCPPPRQIPKKKKVCCEVPCDPCEIMKCFPGNTGCTPCGPPPKCPGLPCVPTGNQCDPSPKKDCCQPVKPCVEGGVVNKCGFIMSDCCPPEPACPPKKPKMGMPPQCGYLCGPPPEKEPCCDPRAHHLNRGPYCCPCKPEPDSNVYRCCESMSSSYAGHIPGFTFHSNGRTTGKASWGTKQYMNKCFYFNTFTKP